MVLTNLDLYELVEEMKLPHFVGVFMKNELPQKKHAGNYIVNLQSSTDGNGTHYCGLKIYDNGEALWFDPFGFEAPKEVDAYVGGKIPFSDKVIQNINSSICGYYCLYFLYYMTKKDNHKSKYDVYQSFIDSFSDNPEDNRRLLEKFMKPI